MRNSELAGKLRYIKINCNIIVFTRMCFQCASDKKLKCVTESNNIQVSHTGEPMEGHARSRSHSYTKTGQTLLYITLSVLLLLGTLLKSCCPLYANLY